MAKWQTGVMLTFIALTLLIASFVLPWYGTYREGPSGYSYSNGVETSIGYSDSGYGMPLWFGATFYGGDSVNVVYGITALFMILAMIFLGMMLLSFLYFGVGKLETVNLPKILGVLAIIFCILAPIVFMASLPGAMKSDRMEETTGSYTEPKGDDPTKSFFGSNTEGKITTRWGGDIGWALPFISIIFIGIALSSSLRDERQFGWTPVSRFSHRTIQPQPSYQQPPIQQQYQPFYQKPYQQIPKPTLIKCPRCNNQFEVSDPKRPLTIQCPMCGTSGILER